jgi:hypothetical protein
MSELATTCSVFCPGRPGRLSALSVSHGKSVLNGVFVWAREVLNSQKRRFPARAVAECIAFLDSSQNGDGIQAPAPAPTPVDDGSCTNLYDSIHGSGQCEALLTQGYRCQTQFCHTCRYAEYCNLACDYCAPPEPEPEPEPEPPQPCPDDRIFDCRSACIDPAWVGDGFCDDPYEGHFLNCAELEFDGGDCGGTEEITCEDTNGGCPDWAGGGECDSNPGYMLAACPKACDACPAPAEPGTFVVDCLGQRAPTSWTGDGTCDNGIFQHNGRWIDMNCEATGPTRPSLYWSKCCLLACQTSPRTARR